MSKLSKSFRVVAHLAIGVLGMRAFYSTMSNDDPSRIFLGLGMMIALLIIQHKIPGLYTDNGEKVNG